MCLISCCKPENMRAMRKEKNTANQYVISQTIAWLFKKFAGVIITFSISVLNSIRSCQSPWWNDVYDKMPIVGAKKAFIYPSAGTNLNYCQHYPITFNNPRVVITICLEAENYGSGASCTALFFLSFQCAHRNKELSNCLLGVFLQIPTFCPIFLGHPR